MPKGSTSLVVVGVDASHQSLVALVWAAEYARTTGARLRAVAGWQYPTTYGIAPDWSRMDFEAWATQQLETSVAATLGDSPEVGSPSRCRKIQPWRCSLVRTTRTPTRSCAPGSTRTGSAWTIWTGCAGLRGSCARGAPRRRGGGLRTVAGVARAATGGSRPPRARSSTAPGRR